MLDERLRENIGKQVQPHRGRRLASVQNGGEVGERLNVKRDPAEAANGVVAASERPDAAPREAGDCIVNGHEHPEIVAAERILRLDGQRTNKRENPRQ